MRRSEPRLTTVLAIALGLVVSSAPVVGQDTAGRVRVTDAAQLAAMGFGADDIVYMAPGAEKVQRNGVEPASPNLFGTDSPAYSAVPGNQFSPRESSTFSSPLGQGDISLVSGDIFYDAQLDLPGGANVDGVRYWAHDNNAANIEFFLIKSCLPTFDAGLPDFTLLAQGTTTGTPGDVSEFVDIPSTETVDNLACHYWFRARFNAAGSTLRLYKMRTQWFRQISPAPVSAFFDDVPTSHPQFQFIEALRASGITAGCNVAPPLYCPNSTLTRGQMAVFLAKALGLHFQ